MAQIVNGTSRFTAEGTEKASVYTSLKYTYSAYNNRIFIILTGLVDDDDLADPGEFEIEVNFWLDVPEDEAVVIEEEEDDGTIKKKTIINGTITETEIIWTDPPEKVRIPQQKFTVFIACFVGSVLLYGICSILCCRKKN